MREDVGDWDLEGSGGLYVVERVGVKGLFQVFKESCLTNRRIVLLLLPRRWRWQTN